MGSSIETTSTICAEERASMDGRLAGLSRDWVALDPATKDNLERIKGGELMLRRAQDNVEVLKRCQNEQTSIMASVGCLSSSFKLLIHPYILVGQWQVLMWRVEREGDEGKSSRGCGGGLLLPRWAASIGSSQVC